MIAKEKGHYKGRPGEVRPRCQGSEGSHDLSGDREQIEAGRANQENCRRHGRDSGYSLSDKKRVGDFERFILN